MLRGPKIFFFMPECVPITVKDTRNVFNDFLHFLNVVFHGFAAHSTDYVLARRSKNYKRKVKYLSLRCVRSNCSYIISFIVGPMTVLLAGSSANPISNSKISSVPFV